MINSLSNTRNENNGYFWREMPHLPTKAVGYVM